jgi:uncharacterized protein (TIGR02246 family)
VKSSTGPGSDQSSAREEPILSLYHELLDCWNRRDPKGFASLFTAEGGVVGFDGSLLDGPAAIEAELARVFAVHQTASFVPIPRWVRFLGPDVAILRGVVGMVPPGKSEIEPSVNAIQSLVARSSGGTWRIALFQNTPAAFHGRPEQNQTLTEELAHALAKRGGAA